MTIYTNPGFTFAGQIGYSKEEVDQRLQQKANTAQTFSKAEVSERFAALEAEVNTAIALANNSIVSAVIVADTETTAKFNLYDPSGGSYNITFPATPITGTEVVVKHNGAGNTLTLTDVVGTPVLNSGDTGRAVYDGTQWIDIT